MAIATTAKFEEYVLEVEFTPGSGAYSKLCGLTDYTVNRTNNVDESTIPDCDDESLPYYIARSVRSQDCKISGTGSWALESHKNIYAWYKAGTTLNVRIKNAVVMASGTTGDPESETIPMILVSLNNDRTKGQTVMAEIELSQNGSVTVTDKI